MADTAWQEKMHCHLCLWFYVASGSGESATGECRRYAPRPQASPVVGGWDSGSSSMKGTDWTNTDWAWPYCQGDWWCGEFLQNGDAP